MTDGPFKNTKLGRCWRQLEEAVLNDAASQRECGTVASDALTRHLVTKDHVKALQEINTHLSNPQLDLDPLGSVEAVFDRCEKTPFLDALEKEIVYRVAKGSSLREAIAPAVDAAIGGQIGETRNRFHEECIRAQETGDISRRAADQARLKINAAFDAVQSEKVRDALLSGRKDAFKQDLGRTDSVDEGLVRL